ncbi:MAG: LptE family protein [Sphingobacteriales bacterium]|jgi:hypothetical protein|nr:LptE family protein [Sphingobacteriales bacterium]
MSWKISQMSIANNKHYLINKMLLVICIFSAAFMSSCKIYRFTDASVDPNWKTFTLSQTLNIATLQNPNAAPSFTESLKEKFLRDTRLALNRDNGDLEFSATITEYSIEPVSITNTETTAQNRLNITVKVECVNNSDKSKGYSQTFRDGENYDANRQFSDVENGLVSTIYERLVQQIFNRTFGNW